MIYKLPQESFRRIVASTAETLGYDILFYHSTLNEFVEMVGKMRGKNLPFFYINTVGAYSSGNVWTIPDIVIATKSNKDWISSVRDEKSFKPFLLPILKEVIRRLQFDKHISLSKEGTTHLHYFYGQEGLNGHEAHKFTEAIDAIQLKDFKFRISNYC